MATKVKTKTPVDTKVDAKAAAKEKEAAQRTKLIEKAVPAVAKKISEQIETRKKSDNLFLEVADLLKESIEENGFTKQEARQVVLSALAEANGIEVEEINHKNPKALTLYTYASKVLTLVFPKDKAAEKELDKARDKGVGVESLLAVARGSKTAAQSAKVGKRGGDTSNSTPKVNGKAVITEIDTFKNELSALLMRAIKGEAGDMEALEEAFAEVSAEIQTTMEEADAE